MSDAGTHRGSHFTPSKGTGAEKHGPILSPMESGMVPEGAENRKSTGGGVYNGLDAPYMKGTPTEMAEISFDTSGNFGKVPKVND